MSNKVPLPGKLRRKRSFDIMNDENEVQSMSKQGNGQTEVVLYVYDLTMGMAKQLSAMILGKQIDGIWHTGIVAFGYEYYYGGGIQASLPGESLAGTPGQKIILGKTSLTQNDFHDYLRQISNRFTPETYSLLKHNCNNFTSECSQFLVGKDIPKWITGLPEEALNSPMGQPIRQMIEQQEQAMRQGMSQIVPWQENSNEYLNLPPIGGGRSTYSNSSGQNDQTPKTEEKKDEILTSVKKIDKITISEEKKDEIPSLEKIENPWLKKDKVPSPEKKDEIPSVDSHPHTCLNLSVVCADKHASLLSKDKKYKSFSGLIKSASNKLKKKNPSLALTQNERLILKKAIDICSQGTPDGIVQDTFILFDRLINNWPVSSMYSVLGLLKSLILRPEGYGYYKDKDLSCFDPIIKLIPDSDAQDDEKKELIAPTAVQVMALCTIANLFGSPSIASNLGKESKIIDMALSALRSEKERVRLMGATLLYNCSIYMPKDDSDSVVESVALLAELIPGEKNLEICYRSLFALGQLMYQNSTSANIVSELSLDISLKSNIGTNKTQEKINGVYSDIQKILAFEQDEQGEAVD